MTQQINNLLPLYRVSNECSGFLFMSVLGIVMKLQETCGVSS